MIGSIAGLVVIVLGGLIVSAWIRLRRSSEVASDVDRGGPADGTTSGDDGSGWLNQLAGDSSGGGAPAHHHPSASDAGGSDSANNSDPARSSD